MMTTQAMETYLKLHEMTICKDAAEGEIPAVWMGKVRRFNKEIIVKRMSIGCKVAGDPCRVQ